MQYEGGRGAERKQKNEFADMGGVGAAWSARTGMDAGKPGGCRQNLQQYDQAQTLRHRHAPQIGWRHFRGSQDEGKRARQ